MLYGFGSFLPGFLAGGFAIAVVASFFDFLAFLAVEHENAKKHITTTSNLVEKVFTVVSLV
ncbi:MAG: hypothetical protein Wins2KO_23920 [Winogradskyella sp.]